MGGGLQCLEAISPLPLCVGLPVPLCVWVGGIYPCLMCGAIYPWFSSGNGRWVGLGSADVSTAVRGSTRCFLRMYYLPPPSLGLGGMVQS